MEKPVCVYLQKSSHLAIIQFAVFVLVVLLDEIELIRHVGEESGEKSQ
jgi:hypothetical protein